MAQTIYKYIGKWDTLHNNGPFNTNVLLDTNLEDSNRMPDPFDRYNDAATEIQRLLQKALEDKEGFRAMGSRWSLNHIAHHKHNIHHNRNMNLKFNISTGDLHNGTGYKSEDLLFVQCGNRIKEISAHLLKSAKSLKATGASNGQTIAGCIATGVHGSALDVGAIPEYVVGINLITGPDVHDIIYVERASKPALSDAFAAQINARVVRDDDIFNAALVSLGAFGFIHGVLIEAEDNYLLKRYVGTMKKEDAIQLSSTLDFSQVHQLVKTHNNALHQEVDAQGNGLRPWHYKVLVNPYNKNEDYYVELLYKKPYKTVYPNPIPLVKHTVSPDIITFMSGLLASKRWAIPAAIKLLSGNIFPKTNTDPIEGRIDELFYDALHQGPAFAFAVAFNPTHFREVIELYTNTITDKNKGYIPGAFGIRFIKQSTATLGFTRFPFTCIIEVDGTLPKPQSKPRKKVDEKLLEFSRVIMHELQQKGIEFTLHWGKNGDWKFPGLLHYMYDAASIAAWKQARASLMPNPEMVRMFTNDFLEDIGLD
jgi:hypothetical protein